MTSVGDLAFAGCSSLTSITIPDSVTSIGDSAFSHCSSLTSITIPDSVTFIGEATFNNCKRLTDVYYSGTQEQWEAITVGASNDSLRNATIHYIQVPQYSITAQSDGMRDRTRIKFVVNGGESEDPFSVGESIQYPEGTKI